jgi:mRNA interferase RelE/StbE
VGSKSKYLIKVRPQVESDDLVALPDEIRDIYRDLIEVLELDPHDCLGLPSHSLRGLLMGCRAIEISVNEYRLVYKIHEKPAPRRVEVLSFAEHDPAYELATERIGKSKDKNKRK